MSSAILLSCSLSDSQAVLRIDEHGWANQNLVDKTVDRYTITSANLTPEIRKELLATVGLHCEIHTKDTPKTVEIYCNYIEDCIELEGAEVTQEADALQVEDLQNKLKWLNVLHIDSESKLHAIGVQYNAFGNRYECFLHSLAKRLYRAEENGRKKSAFFTQTRKFLGFALRENHYDREVAAYRFVLNQLEEFRSRRSD